MNPSYTSTGVLRWAYDNEFACSRNENAPQYECWEVGREWALGMKDCPAVAHKPTRKEAMNLCESLEAERLQALLTIPTAH